MKVIRSFTINPKINEEAGRWSKRNAVSLSAKVEEFLKFLVMFDGQMEFTPKKQVKK